MTVTKQNITNSYYWTPDGVPVRAISNTTKDTRSVKYWTNEAKPIEILSQPRVNRARNWGQIIG